MQNEAFAPCVLPPLRHNLQRFPDRGLLDTYQWRRLRSIRSGTLKIRDERKQNGGNRVASSGSRGGPGGGPGN